MNSTDLNNSQSPLLERKKSISRLSSELFDLTIIGGGITGAGIALDAVTRGLKVALIDKNDFAFGTSSRSTKLIHGGLRYLKNLEFKLVRDMGKERAIAFNNAPHLVSKEKMLLPLIKGGTYKKLSISFGLWLYDLLAGVKKNEKRIMLNKRKTLVFEKLLNPDGLRGSGFFTEYRTDDARLTIEIIKTAISHGAVCINYCKCIGLAHDKSENHTKIKEVFSDKELVIRSKKVVNASGPWVDEIRAIDEDESDKRIFHSKGIHIVVPRKKLNVTNPLYFDIDDGRMIFVIPRQKITYIGTTDTSYAGPLDEPGVTLKDVRYLLSGVNKMFPTVSIDVKDVISSWSGLRPLIHKKGKSLSELSRKDELFRSDKGLITIAGGKFTGYRLMAKKVIDLVSKELKKSNHCITDRIPITRPSFNSQVEVQKFKSSLIDEYKPRGIKTGEIEFLVSTFGPNSKEIFQNWEKFQGRSLTESMAYYSIHNELALTLNDFYIRRTGFMYFTPSKIRSSLDPVTLIFAKELEWSEKRINIEKKTIQDYLNAITDFR